MTPTFGRNILFSQEFLAKESPQLGARNKCTWHEGGFVLLSGSTSPDPSLFCHFLSFVIFVVWVVSLVLLSACEYKHDFPYNSRFWGCNFGSKAVFQLCFGSCMFIVFLLLVSWSWNVFSVCVRCLSVVFFLYKHSTRLLASSDLVFCFLFVCLFGGEGNFWFFLVCSPYNPPKAGKVMSISGPQVDIDIIIGSNSDTMSGIFQNLIPLQEEEDF